MSFVYRMIILYVLSFKIDWHIFQVMMMFKEMEISAFIMLLYYLSIFMSITIYHAH